MNINELAGRNNSAAIREAENVRHCILLNRQNLPPDCLEYINSALGELYKLSAEIKRAQMGARAFPPPAEPHPNRDKLCPVCGTVLYYGANRTYHCLANANHNDQICRQCGTTLSNAHGTFCPSCNPGAVVDSDGPSMD